MIICDLPLDLIFAIFEYLGEADLNIAKLISRWFRDSVISYMQNMTINYRRITICRSFPAVSYADHVYDNLRIIRSAIVNKDRALLIMISDVLPKIGILKILRETAKNGARLYGLSDFTAERQNYALFVDIMRQKFGAALSNNSMTPSIVPICFDAELSDENYADIGEIFDYVVYIFEDICGCSEYLNAIIEYVAELDASLNDKLVNFLVSVELSENAAVVIAFINTIAFINRTTNLKYIIDEIQRIYFTNDIILGANGFIIEVSQNAIISNIQLIIRTSSVGSQFAELLGRLLLQIKK